MMDKGLYGVSESVPEAIMELLSDDVDPLIFAFFHSVFASMENQGVGLKRILRVVLNESVQ